MSSSSRRSFLSRFAAGAAAVAGGSFVPTRLEALASPSRIDPSDAWLAKLDGKKHKQIWDTVSVTDGGPLRPVRNYLNAWRDAYGLKDADVQAIVGLHGGAIAMSLGDASWAKLGVGQALALKEPGSEAFLQRNPFVRPKAGDAVPAEWSVDALQRRGVLFLVCNNAFTARVTGMAERLKLDPTEAVAAAKADLVPGFVIVPAMVVALNQAQERGVAYVYGR